MFHQFTVLGFSGNGREKIYSRNAGIKIQSVSPFSTPHQNLIVYINKAFSSDLRLANWYSQHIRSMVTIILCYKERPYNKWPPFLRTYDHARLCFPATFRQCSAFKILYFIVHTNLPKNLNRVLSYSYRQLVLYTHFCASPRNRLFGITNSGYRRHSDSILAYSPQERLLLCPRDT